MRKRIDDHLKFILPEISRNNCINAFITNDGHLMGFYGDIDQHTITLNCFVNSELSKNLRSPVQDINITYTFDMYFDFARGLFFSISNCSLNQRFIFSGKQILHLLIKIKPGTSMNKEKV